MKDFDYYMRNIHGKGTDDLAELVKRMPVFPTYIDMVRRNDECAENFFKLIVMTEISLGREFADIFYSVSVDVAISLLEQKIKSEILKGEGNDNQNNG